MRFGGKKRTTVVAILFWVLVLVAFRPATGIAAELEETVSVPTPGSFQIQLESAAAWQTRNTFRIPSNGGTEVRLADFQSGPFFSGRVYADWKINEHHGLRALIAPLSVSVSYTPTQALSISGKTFAAGTPVTTRYTFSSYRLTYRYTINPESVFSVRVGFTAKVRDANITTSNGSQVAEYPNLGFVPLLHFGVRWWIDEQWYADLDADALAAPQGRAEDVALRLGYLVDRWDVSLGYRMLEGGADNDRVFTFAFLHYVFGSIGFSF